MCKLILAALLGCVATTAFSAPADQALGKWTCVDDRLESGTVRSEIELTPKGKFTADIWLDISLSGKSIQAHATYRSRYKIDGNSFVDRPKRVRMLSMTVDGVDATKSPEAKALRGALMKDNGSIAELSFPGPNQLHFFEDGRIECIRYDTLSVTS
ncbi:MAG: hypothetical protein JXR13_02965 [Thalassovita sp.]